MLPLMVFGTAIKICVSLQLLTAAATLFKVTVLVPWEDPNPDPFRVTDMPTAPVVGDKVEITGFGIVKIWLVLLPMVLTETVTGPVVAW
jgi:hypothetical protein